MRIYLAIAAAAATISTVAIAQPANRDATTPAINSPNSPANSGALAAGAHSFTEGSRASNPTAMPMSAPCGRTTRAYGAEKQMKDGKSINVSLDFQGNVTAQ